MQYWNKPEGKVGVFLILLPIALIITFAFAAPSVLTATGTFFTSAVGVFLMLLILGLLLFLVLDPRLRQLFTFLFVTFSRKIAGLFTEVNPLGVMKAHVADLEKNLDVIRRQKGKLRVQLHQLYEQLYKNTIQIDDHLEIVVKAKKNSDRKVMMLHSRKAARLKESNDRLEALYVQLKKIYHVINRMNENSMILVEDVSHQVEIKERESSAISAGHGAMRSAMNILNGNTDQKQMFDRAMEETAEEIALKVGEMERLMKKSEALMDRIDLQKGVMEDKGLQMMEEWNKENAELEEKYFSLRSGESEFPDPPSKQSIKNENPNLQNLK